MQPPNLSDFAEETLSSQPVFEGRLLTLRVDTVRLPDGHTATREIVGHPGAVAIVPLTEDGQVYLVRQWRHPLQRVTLEIPAGTLSAGESPEDCLHRELAEEINMQAARFDHLLDIFVSQGYSDELIRLYLGTGLTPAEGSPDEDETLQVVKIGLEDAVHKCFSGEIGDAKSIVALLAVQFRRLGLE